MLAKAVRLALAAELVTWAALGTWLAATRGWHPVTIVAVALIGATGSRLLLVIVSFGLSWLWRAPLAPDARLGLSGIAILVAGEWIAMLANNFLWLPFEHAVLRADPPLAPASRAPVILVHGYLSNRGTMCGLARALDAAGVGPVFVPSLPVIGAPIETVAAHLERLVREVTLATGQPRAMLVCHSMGGLIARAYLRAHGTGRVAGLVTIACPHHGSRLAVLGFGESGRQMRVGSAFLRELERAEGRSGPGCATVSVYSMHDNMVAPQDSSRLAWAQNHAVSGIAHLAMLLDSRVHRAVLQALTLPAA